MTTPRRSLPVPLLTSAIGLFALAATYLLPSLLDPAPAWPRFQPIRSGCEPARRTERHAGGAVLGAGAYMPCLFDTGMASGEPGLAIASDGTLLRSVTKAPTGIAVSLDGLHWQRRALPAGTRDGIPDGYLDPVTGRYFYSAIGDTPVYATDDKGASWQKGTFDSHDRYDWNKVFSGPPVTRRAGYPTNIYYCNMTQPGGFATGARCFRSSDGGRHFRTSGADPYKAGDCHTLTQPQGSGAGRGVVDPRDGTIYLPVHFCGAVEVAVSKDEGRSWTRRTVDRMRGSAAHGILAALASPSWRHQLMSGRGNVVPAEMAVNQFSDALGIDGAGRLYLLWIDEDFLPVLARSEDGALSWSRPQPIRPPGVVQAVLPAIAVTAAGRIGLSYYGSTDRQTWTGYLSIADDGAAAGPMFETAAVTPLGRPLMPEACCWASGPQEYTVARWAPDGSLWGAFVATGPKDARGVVARLVRR